MKNGQNVRSSEQKRLEEKQRLEIFIFASARAYTISISTDRIEIEKKKQERPGKSLYSRRIFFVFHRTGFHSHLSLKTNKALKTEVILKCMAMMKNNISKQYNILFITRKVYKYTMLIYNVSFIVYCEAYFRCCHCVMCGNCIASIGS